MINLNWLNLMNKRKKILILGVTGQDGSFMAKLLSEKKYENQKGAFTLGRYKIEVKSFGGKIRTLFIAIKGLILEFVQDEKNG